MSITTDMVKDILEMGLIVKIITDVEIQLKFWLKPKFKQYETQNKEMT